MAQKRSKVRKVAAVSSNAAATTIDGESGSSAPPDRATWSGWVEMESEPAFFNVMLKEMGVRGVKVQEVYDLGEEFLAMLPQPVHALIFLFRFRETENPQVPADGCPKHVWFANQTPDFACATFALLNIVNNIPDLELGDELRQFKVSTQDMDPLSRGDAVDGFDFVRRIHNSFARDNDILETDIHLRDKASKLKKRQALAKARETRELKKVGKTEPATPQKRKSESEEPPTRSTRRRKIQSPGDVDRSLIPAKEGANATGRTAKRGITKSGTTAKKTLPTKKAKKSPKEESRNGGSNAEFETPSTARVTDEAQTNGLRRSERAPKSRKDIATAAAAAEAAADEGFHFCAYMPINGHVWKLDGLDRYPQDMGSFSEDDGGNWMHVAQPTLMGRMAQYEASEIQFNIMAIVHDTLSTDRVALLQNVKTLRTVDAKLSGLCEDRHTMEGAETKKDVVTESASELNVAAADIESAQVPAEMAARIKKKDDLLELIELRQGVIAQQVALRAMLRDALEANKEDDRKARHRRHDYAKFIDSWLGALAEQELLTDLIDA
ncbi:hypothetical protein BAUCODRAFT_30723 [Baudoinia panamericana UAMH 10762]|uniref:Ubiquitin carboxyl-terminal hydrolase n=1 Tax=Baudoinia panamericana (strain UAMH 10762) TaxID=717646 RepID=M2MTL4_BAUPA|nr:uncharacterized protein BAUCODRAFT_30723 [Baudoinia panamericana UAMH 10762]EMD00252.1 hypothetical protein BAUCODRAFT_30723 [Baudoinia panamericana UAMH 10762]